MSAIQPEKQCAESAEEARSKTASWGPPLSPRRRPCPPRPAGSSWCNRLEANVAPGSKTSGGTTLLQKDSQRSTPRSHVHECKRGGAIKASLVPAKRRSRAAAARTAAWDAAAQQQRRGKKAEAREPDSAGWGSRPARSRDAGVLGRHPPAGAGSAAAPGEAWESGGAGLLLIVFRVIRF